MQIKTRLETLQELRNDTQWKLCENEAVLRSQEKVLKDSPDKVIRKIMDPEMMAVRAVTLKETVEKNREAVASLRALLAEIDLMIEEETK